MRINLEPDGLAWQLIGAFIGLVLGAVVCIYILDPIANWLSK